MPADSRSGPTGAIAIVGIGCHFAGAATPEQLWTNLRAGTDATSDVPPGRWLIDPAAAFDRRIARVDHVYTTRGGFVATPRFDPRGTGLDGDLLDRLDPVFHLALSVAYQAWRDARTEAIDPRRAGTVFGNIVLPTETASAMARQVLAGAFEEWLSVAAAAPGTIDPRNAFPAGLPAALVARALGLGGVAYTLDAACGSSLYALKLALDELRSGRADVMLSGGVSRPDALYTQMGFSQLRALSPRGKAAPLDHSADGLIVGEGAGMFVLKRLADALRQGDHIYGIVAGIGLSNDVHSDLLAPDAEGQLRAMRAAYEQAGWRPEDVDLIECHATGTPRGDTVELESLQTLWEDARRGPNRCVIGSVKGNIGHTLTAAGAAGLLKVLLALKHRVLPPTAHFERAAPNQRLEQSPFRILTAAEPWPARAPDQPRRAAVSGFGFGGINAHALIEEWVPPPAPARAVRSPGLARGEAAGPVEPAPIAIVGLSAQIGPMQGKQAFWEFVLGEARPVPATRPSKRWEVAERQIPTGQGREERSFPGYYLTSLEFGVREFRIPPKELSEMLPQQSLMLRVAAEAIRDAGWDTVQGLRTGVLIGIGLDLNTTNFHLRWWLPTRAAEWSQTLALELCPEELARWTEDLRSAAGPPLTANRTMGSLGGLVASRIAREFRIGGPSFTISCDESSGIQAMAIAVEWLRRGELDAAVVGAVDFAGDLRAVLARDRLGLGRTPVDDGDPRSCACDGAVSLVLKRLADAQRDGDRVYAVIRGLGSATGEMGSGRPSHPDADSDAAIGLLEASSPSLEEAPRLGESGDSGAVGSLQADIGQAGAAAGLLSVAKAAMCLDHQVLPPSPTEDRSPRGAEGPSRSFPTRAQFWLRNRAEGPRRASVHSSSLGGIGCHVLLEEPGGREAAGRSTPVAGPAVPRRLGLFAIEAEDDAGVGERLRELDEFAQESPAEPIDSLARRWWRRHGNQPRLRRGVAIVACGVESLRRLLDRAGRRANHPEEDRDAHVGGSIHARGTDAARIPKRVALVYPGLGNDFEGMGRELSLLWPEVLRAQDAGSRWLRDQFEPAVWWNGQPSRTFPDHRTPILGQVALGSLVTDILRGLGVVPDAAIGYSMGESAALVALRAWTDRDELHHRLGSSPLFQAELAGPCHAARRAWGIPAAEPVDWVAGIVPRPADEVRTAIAGRGRVYVLIKNSAEETVLGGYRRSVDEVVRALRCPFIELPAVSTVHCPIGRSVEPEYRALHDLETIAPAGITFYSGVWGRPYALDRRSAAEAITAQATQPIDFPALIERAYREDVGVFLEVGPGSSCTRLIDRILGTRPHLARSACRPDRDPLAAILEVLGDCIAHRLPVDLGSLYGGRTDQDAASAAGALPLDDAGRATVQVVVGGGAFVVPAPPRPSPLAPSRDSTMRQREALAPAAVTMSPGSPIVLPREARGPEPPVRPEPFGERFPFSDPSPWIHRLSAAEQARTEAHRAFLRVTEGTVELMGRLSALQLELIEGSRPGATPAQPDHDEQAAAVLSEPSGTSPSPAALFDRWQCLQLAVGSVALVLGPDFQEVDGLPTRVRLPDEPLMLVDRILSLEGTPRSLQGGRIVTEHDIQPGAWYLDQDRAAPCIVMEAGQADLVLSGYLGVDFVTRGLAVYRLLDATVTFHRGLPRAGAVLHYDIRITGFFRQGTTILFRFEFDATVAGEPMLTMRDGCAGFFTPEELASGKGIVPHSVEGRSQSELRLSPGEELIPTVPGCLDERQVEALRQGDLASAFGSPFDRLSGEGMISLPGGRMSLIHRVPALDPTGGPAGLGLIRAEADIHAGDWFMVCHFIDDRVMPGTLMYECCLHTLRIFMMRLGWVGRGDRVAFEPVPGIANRLKCRGQITESTRVVVYELTIKERGFRPEPYAVADALIIADGQPIVAVFDLALQLTGTSRQELERLWEAVAR